MMKNYKMNFSGKLKGSLKRLLLKSVIPSFLICLVFTQLSAQVNSCGTPNASISTSAVSGSLGGGSINGANLAYDRTTGYQTGNSYAAFALPTVGVNVTQTLTIGFIPSDIGDSVEIIGELPSNLSVSLLGGITAQAFNGTTAVGSAQTISSLLSLFNLGTTGMFAVGYTPDATAAFDRVVIKITSSVGVTLSGDALRIYDVSVLPTAPQLYATGCYSVASGLRVASPQGRSVADNGLNLTYSWYATATGTTPLTTTTGSTSTNSTFASSTSLGITANGTYTYYITTAKTNCTNDLSARTPVTFNVGNPTTTVTASCTANTTRLLATAPIGGTSTAYNYLWSTTNGTITAGGATNNPTITNNGTYNLIFTDANGCAGSKSVTLANYSATCGTSLILPAIGLSLSASVTTGKPVLIWSTLQESNTSHYSVEASSDGTSFIAIGKVAAVGNSIIPSTYTFTDVTSTGAIVYYRVKLVDVDGGVTYSNVFSLRLSGSALAKIYPNPVTNFVNIETGAAGTYIAELFTIDGKKLTSTSLSTASGLVTLTINRSNVTSGVYLLKVTGKATAMSTYNTIMVK